VVGSDIDLAGVGLPEGDYFTAVGKVQGVDPNFSVDVVEIQHARPHILSGVCKELSCESLSFNQAHRAGADQNLESTEQWVERLQSSAFGGDLIIGTICSTYIAFITE